MARITSRVKIQDSQNTVIDIFGGGVILTNYAAADKDDQVNPPSYYGFLDVSGNWYIMQVGLNNILYIKGSTGYTTAWTGRTGLSYLPFDQVF